MRNVQTEQWYLPSRRHHTGKPPWYLQRTKVRQANTVVLSTAISISSTHIPTNQHKTTEGNSKVNHMDGAVLFSLPLID